MKAGRRPTAKTVTDYFSSGSGRKLWKEGLAEKENVGNGFGEFDDGKYRAKLVKAYTAMSNSTGRPQNVLAFKFLEGDYKGKLVFQYQGLDQKTGIGIALQTLTKLGQEVSAPDEIDDADKALTKTQPDVEIRLRTKGEYQNVIVTAVLAANDDEDTEEEDEDVDVEEDEDDEKPSKSGKSKKTAATDDEDADEEADEDSSDDADAGEVESDDGEEDDEEAEESTEDEDEEDEKPAKKPAKKVKPSDDEAEDADEEDEDSDDEDEEDEEKEEEEIALEPGMKLKIKYEGETVKAKIVKVDEKNEQVRVKLADGSKVTIDVSAIEAVL